MKFGKISHSSLKLNFQKYRCWKQTDEKINSIIPARKKVLKSTPNAESPPAKPPVQMNYICVISNKEIFSGRFARFGMLKITDKVFLAIFVVKMVILVNCRLYTLPAKSMEYRY